MKGGQKVYNIKGLKGKGKARNFGKSIGGQRTLGVKGNKKTSRFTSAENKFRDFLKKKAFLFRKIIC